MCNFRVWGQVSSCVHYSILYSFIILWHFRRASCVGRVCGMVQRASRRRGCVKFVQHEQLVRLGHGPRGASGDQSGARPSAELAAADAGEALVERGITFDGFMQDCYNSNAFALELLQSCAETSACRTVNGFRQTISRLVNISRGVVGDA